MDIVVKPNMPQQQGIMLNAKNRVDIWGRGTGKSFNVGWYVNLIHRLMPRSIISVTGQTYGQLLTRTLPSTFKLLEEMGHVKGETYRINQRPPQSWDSPLEKVMKYDNFVSFSNGTGLLLLSQDRQGSGRGPNVDYEILDEALTINKERYDQETSPTNRGNDERWGPKGSQPVPFHHGFHYLSSMPFSADQSWLLDFGKYYEEEAGIRIFDIWNRVVKMQLDLLDIEDPREFTQQWNEINRVRKQMAPFVSKDKTLFTLSNAFDNLANVGLSYIRRERQKQTELTFLIEIMNMVMDKVEDSYYNFNTDRQVYHNAYNESFLRDYAENTGWDWKKLGAPDSRFDSDVDTNQPLEVVVDWGSSISFMLIMQENRLVVESTHTHNFVKEFFEKPETDKVMIDDLVDQFCEYYRHHNDKTIHYYRDKYGDERQANSSNTYNDQAIERFRKNGWHVVLVEYKGKEPPHHDKYLLWGNINKENNPKFPKVRINGKNCRNFIIAANNTRVIEKDNKFKKDKRSEHSNSGVPQEQATHSTDAADKIVWIKYSNKMKKDTFVPART